MHYEKWNVGILGPVFLNGLNEGKRSLDSQKWFYTVCMYVSMYVCMFLCLFLFIFSTLFLRVKSNNTENKQIGLKGESLHVYSGSGSNSVRWEVAFPNQPITWYKVSIKLELNTPNSSISFECNENNSAHILQ